MGDDVVPLPDDVLDRVALQSGEGRFRWLHARPGRGRTRCPTPPARCHGDQAWVRTPGRGDRRGLVRRRASPTRRPAGSATSLLAAARRRRLLDPDDTGPYRLVGRHGSLTAAEMLVPLLAGVAG